MEEKTPNLPAEPLPADNLNNVLFENTTLTDGLLQFFDRELQMMLNLVMYQLKRLLKFDSAAVYDHNSNIFLQMHQPDKRFAEILLLPPTQRLLELETHYSRQALHKSEALIIPDFNFLAEMKPDKIQSSEQINFEGLFTPIRAWLGLPLVYRGNKLGLLALRHHRPGYFSERHARVATVTIEMGILAHDRLFNRAQVLALVKERQRIARDLHDSVTQVLYGIELGINSCLSLLEIDPARVAGQLREVLNLAESGMADMRALLLELHPETLEREGLVAALLKLVIALQARQVTVEADLCEEPLITIELKEAIYRITQEALNNVIKHSQATRVNLSLSKEAHQILLKIYDNGLGFDPGLFYAGHLGLSSMRERAELIKGCFEITSNPDHGTWVRLTIPL